METWEQQFYFAPLDQKVSFLYLANDILQNNRRRCLEFVGELWRVLPGALNDVVKNGDDYANRVVLILVCGHKL